MEISGVFAYPGKVLPGTLSTTMAWFRGKPTFKQSLDMLDFGSKVRGTITASLTNQGATSVKWVVAVESSEQAKAAAETLAKMLLKVVGVRLVGYRLPDSATVTRAVMI